MGIKYYQRKYRQNLSNAETQKDFLMRLITKMNNELDAGDWTKQERVKMFKNIILATKTLTDVDKNELMRGIEARLKSLELDKKKT